MDRFSPRKGSLDASRGADLFQIKKKYEREINKYG